MTRKKLRAFLFLFSILYWVLVSMYFIMLRYTGFGQYAQPDLSYRELLIYSAVVGFFIGLFLGIFPVGHSHLLRKQKSFGAVVLIGTTCQVLFFFGVILITSLYGNSLHFALSYVLSPNGLSAFLHFSLASLLYHFVLQINKRFGPGILLEYTFGKYFNSREEERTFMFLDLQSSTHLAETLEHVFYSQMIQDCFAELSEPLLKHKGQVYQYVGDEVVISWKMNRYFSASNCYEFFYAFRNRLEAKREYFLCKYGVNPKFKAGIHCGKVIATEVGGIKTEIAYHGDVINTASRIQSLCNRFQCELLVSETFVSYISQKDHDRVDFVIDTLLKGKETTMKIYSIADSSTKCPQRSLFIPDAITPLVSD